MGLVSALLEQNGDQHHTRLLAKLLDASAEIVNGANTLSAFKTLRKMFIFEAVPVNGEL